jgi:hypothetical protein
VHYYVDNITIDASRAIPDSDDTNNYINNFATIPTWPNSARGRADRRRGE